MLYEVITRRRGHGVLRRRDVPGADGLGVPDPPAPAEPAGVLVGGGGGRHLCPVNPRHVITSYSIHYTKLYDILIAGKDMKGLCHHDFKERQGFASNVQPGEYVITSYSIHYTKLYEAPR